ncbi:MAG: hypothetical protein MUC80_08160 [Candidatus Thermoplasmatota archaeon]|jgi:hypothetical protein|nr:hypothetical protein [Candidatus Thermoplasmatota archaeon]
MQKKYTPKTKSQLIKSNNAVVGVVTAVLLIGLIVAVISLIQTIYIPKIMEQREAEHMDKVAEQFTYLTSVIDGQAADQSKNLPVATSVTLGSKELPYMLSIKAFGTLQILDNARFINITLSDGTTVESFPIGVISYSSINGYFLDQTYTYEAGAMIVSQTEGNLMMVRPSLFIEYDSTHNILNLTFDVVNITSVGQKTIASGFGTYPIQTEFYQVSTNVTYTAIHDVTIETPLSNAWYMFTDSLLKTTVNDNQYDLTDTGHSLVLDAFSGLTVNINYKIIDIRAQIGPGWVQQ